MRYTEAAGGTCTGPPYWCNDSGRWMEGQERVLFCVIFPPGVGAAVYRGVVRIGTGGRTELGAGIN